MDGAIKHNCAHCGLAAPRGAEYCCFGCELAAKIRQEGAHDHARLFATFNLSLVLSMVIMMLSLFLYAEDVFDAHGDTELAWMRSAYRFASAILATPVMALAGHPLLRHAWTRLKRAQISMEVLIAGGAFTAYAISLAALFDSTRAIYFESATAAIVLSTLGRYLEASARSNASKTLGPLLNLSRGPVWLKHSSGEWLKVAASTIVPGDHLRVPLEETVPADLRLVSETAEVDLGVLTGEPKPQLISKGGLIPAGAVVISAVGEGIEGIAQNSARESTAEKLAQLAKSLHEHPSASMRWADRLARWLTPLVALIAAATALYWGTTADVGTAIVNTLAVVLVACPCTYGVAAPLVHWLVLQRALELGALVRSAEAIEELDRAKVVAFDKTGTLTSALEVEAMVLAPGVDRTRALSLVRALEEGSRHPLAKALFTFASAAEPAILHDRRFVSGTGVFARDERGEQVGLRAVRSSAEGGDVELFAGTANIARFSIDEQLRPQAKETVQTLRAEGLEVLILSGDRSDRVERIAARLGITGRGSLSPKEKTQQLADLGSRAVMIGDGLNDAPAAAGVSVSIAIGGATDLLRGLADVTLADTDLEKIPALFQLAKRAMRTVRRMIFFSTLYNAVFIAFAAAGMLKPVFAGLSMLIASLLALAFAARLQGEVEEAPC